MAKINAEQIHNAEKRSHGFSAAAHLVARRDPRFDLGHCHMDIEIQCWDRPVEMLHGGTVYRLEAKAVALFWAGRPHQLLGAVDGSVPRVCWITIPVVWLQTWRIGSTFTNRLLSGQLITADKFPNGSERVAEWAELMEQGHDDARIAYHELQAFLLRLRDSGQVLKQVTEQQRVPPAVLKTITWLMEHVTEGCNARDVGPALGMHTKYLMSLFKQHVGQSLQQYINNMRVVEASAYWSPPKTRSPASLSMPVSIPSIVSTPYSNNNAA